MVAKQHAGLSPERFKQFSPGQQILMIANEMNRASKLMSLADRERLLGSYERVLALTDLTIGACATRGRQRELLRWRDLIAEQFVAPHADAGAHAGIFRALLQLHPEAFRQLPYVTGAASF